MHRFTTHLFPPHAYIPTQTTRSAWQAPQIASAKEMFLYGVDLFHHGFYWESHEVWEELWKKEPLAGRKNFLQGLILCAAFLIKKKQGELEIARKISASALQKLTGVSPWVPCVFFDDDCDFCARNIVRWQSAVQEEMIFLPSLQPIEERKSLRLIDCNGKIYEGAGAVFRIRSSQLFWKQIFWLYRSFSPFRWLSEALYRLIAHRRS